MPPYLSSAAVAGLLSGAAFCVVALLKLDFVFMFLPTLPLFYIGLSRGALPLLAAAFIAAVIILPLGGVVTSLFFLLVFALPAGYIAKQALLQSSAGDWQKLGPAFLTLSSFACAIVALVTLHYATTPGGIEQALSQQMQAEFSAMGEEYNAAIQEITSQWTFFIFGLTIWIWNLSLYAHAWMANRLLARRGGMLRPSLAIVPFAMPGWILYLLAIAGLASLIGSSAMQFVGKTCFIALLFPYFLLGVALVHERCKNWPSRRFFLFFMYAMIFIQFWPALIVTAMGVFYHIKGLSAAPTSTKS